MRKLCQVVSQSLQATKRKDCGLAKVADDELMTQRRRMNKI